MRNAIVMTSMTMKGDMQRRGLILVLLALVSVTLAWAQPADNLSHPAVPARYVLQPASRIWIEGSSTLNEFSCASDAMSGSGVLPETRDGKPTVEVTIPAHTFDCGNRRMNKDLHDALRVEDYPSLRFRLDDLVVDQPSAKITLLEATGRLFIAGTERTVSVGLIGKTRGVDQYYVTGLLPLQMTSFGIEPPTALMGLVRAHDDIVVRFELIVASGD